MQVEVPLPCVRVACHDVGVSAYKEMTDGEVVYARGPYKAKLRVWREEPALRTLR